MKKGKLILLLSFCASISACNMVKLYNSGPYTGDIKRQRAAYYAKETPAQRALRDKNRKICLELSGGYSGNWDQIQYRSCMKERGSPLFTYGED